MMLSMCACSPGAGQTAGCTGAVSSKGHHHHCQQGWHFPLGDSKSNSSVLGQRLCRVADAHGCSLLLWEQRVWCLAVQEKAADSHLGQNESATAVISSSLAFLTKTFEYNIPLQRLPAEISIKFFYM